MHINDILTSVYGDEVREAIADALMEIRNNGMEALKSYYNGFASWANGYLVTHSSTLTVPSGFLWVNSNGTYSVSDYAVVRTRFMLPAAGIIDRTLSGSIVNSTLTSLYPYAFEGCKNLEAVTLSGVSVIGSNAFQNCTRLSYAAFASLTKIEDNAFLGCTNSVFTLNLKHNSVVPSIYESMYDQLSNAGVEVAQSMYWDFLDDPYWSKFHYIATA